MAAKTQEAIQTSAATAEGDAARRKFWIDFIEYNVQVNGPYATSSAGNENWLGKSFGVSGLSVNVIVNRNNCRVELYFNFGDKDINKSKYDFYYKLKDEIQSFMPKFPLVWERLDEKVTCRIKSEKTLSYLNHYDCQEIMIFLRECSQIFINTFSRYNKQITNL